MKRTVILDPGHPSWGGPQPDPTLRHRLAGHLAARLREYNQEGISSVETPEDGVVAAQVAGPELQNALAQLARRRVYCAVQNGALHFTIGAGTSFEDLDYVQSAVAELLEPQ